MPVLCADDLQTDRRMRRHCGCALHVLAASSADAVAERWCLTAAASSRRRRLRRQRYTAVTSTAMTKNTSYMSPCRGCAYLRLLFDHCCVCGSHRGDILKRHIDGPAQRRWPLPTQHKDKKLSTARLSKGEFVHPPKFLRMDALLTPLVAGNKCRP